MSFLRAAAATAFLVAAFAVGAFAQGQTPMAGGYAKISVRSAEAKKAAATAIKDHAASHPKDKVTLIKISKAERQVVAGMNYRVCLAVLDHKGIRREVTAVVFQPLRKKMRLTDWKAGGCQEL